MKIDSFVNFDLIIKKKNKHVSTLNRFDIIGSQLGETISYFFFPIQRIVIFLMVRFIFNSIEFVSLCQMS